MINAVNRDDVVRTGRRSEILMVVLCAGHDKDCVLCFVRQRYLLRQIDVFGVRREAVRDAGKFMYKPCNGSRGIGIMRMEVRDAFLFDLIGDVSRIEKVTGRGYVMKPDERAH